MESAGTRIRQSRKAAKISQNELAKLVGVSQASITYWESDANAPAGSNLLALASALPQICHFRPKYNLSYIGYCAFL